jgi:Uma2 family endonuclease
MSTSTHLITYEESLLMPESNVEEIVDGELLTMPPATIDHNWVIQKLNLMFVRQMSPHLFCIQTTGFLMKSDPLCYRIPDLAVVELESIRREVRTAVDPYSRTIPALVVEVISPANRKGPRERLLQDYAEFGVPEVLFFYTDTHAYESYHGVTLTHTARTGIVAPRTMPEVSIDLNELWPEIE